jgi:hypothetical protein
MASVSVADLARDGRIEAVSPDLNAAWSRLDEAKTHLASSAALAKADPSLAYVALYDAARKAITAHMQAHGYRVTNRPGAHHAVGLYAEATLTLGATGPHVRAFDRMRQVRNRSEYAQLPITKRLLTTDLEHAKAVVAAVEHALPPRPPPL